MSTTEQLGLKGSKMKLLVIDTETCGLKAWIHSPDQVSGMIVYCNEKEVDGKLVMQYDIREKFDIKFVVDPKAEIDEGAYTFRGMTSAEMKNRELSSSKAKQQFCDMLDRYVGKFDKTDKLMPVGYNLNFDLDMMQRWFNLHGDRYFGSYVWRPGIDVMSLALDKLFKYRAKMENFKQGTVAAALGIEIDQARLHDSAYDIEVLWQVYMKVKGVPAKRIYT